MNKFTEKKDKTTPYPISALFCKYSPMKTTSKVRHYLKQYKKDHRSVGFTITSSLKSMGLVPRSDGKFRLGEKYKKIKND